MHVDQRMDNAIFCEKSGANAKSFDPAFAVCAG